MKQRIFFLLLIAGIGWMMLKQAGAQDSEMRVQASQDIPMGERLVYKITWLGIPVGSGELWVKEKSQLAGREVFHVVGTIQTNKVLSKVFPIHDEAHSWIDAETLESLQFEKNVKELRLKVHERTGFDRSQGKGYFESLDSGTKKEFATQVPVHDVLSVVFWTRRQALVPGQSVATVLTADQRDWALELKVLRRQTLKLNGIKIETLRVEPRTVVGGEEKKGKAWINLTDDPSHTPVRVVYKAPVGRLTGTLKKSPKT